MIADEERGPAADGASSRSSTTKRSGNGKATGEQLVTVRDAAFAAHKAGVSVLPPKENGSKAPDAATWTERQRVKTTEEELEGWYSGARTGVGVVCGQISGGLELFEFEGRAKQLAKPFQEAAQALGLGEVWQRVRDGYREVSPTGGVHFFYRCPDPTTTRLASTSDNKPLIETKGEGGYAIVAPSYGKVHPSEKRWVLHRGGWNTIPDITAKQRDALHTLARTFDERPPTEAGEAPAGFTVEGTLPGHGFNASATWKEVLEPHGWTASYVRDGITYWCRPGKTSGAGATTGYEGHDFLYVFTTSTVFESGKGYSKFTAYTLLNHQGDWSASGAELYRQGYRGTSNANEDKRVQMEVGNLRVRERAKQEFAADKRAAADPLEREVAEALMTMTDDDSPVNHVDGWLDEVSIMSLPPVDWLVKGLVQNGGVTVLWGEPGIGKTFVLLGIAKAVSKGKRWQNHATQRGAVLFYESEGLQQFQNRINAFNSRYRWELGESALLKFVPEAVDLTTAKNIAAVIRTGREANRLAQESGDRVRLVVIDPLIENMSGDENNEGMEALSRALRIIAMKLDCAVLAGHHSNASGERERGNSKLRARVLAMMRMERLPDGLVGLVVEKQRNGPRIAMELVPTPHGDSIVLEYQQEMTAEQYALQKTDRQEAAKDAKQARKTGAKTDKAQRLLLDRIELEPGLARDRLLMKCIKQGIGKPALGLALDELIDTGRVRVEEGPRNAQLHHLSD